MMIKRNHDDGACWKGINSDDWHGFDQYMEWWMNGIGREKLHDVSCYWDMSRMELSSEGRDASREPAMHWFGLWSLRLRGLSGLKKSFLTTPSVMQKLFLDRATMIFATKSVTPLVVMLIQGQLTMGNGLGIGGRSVSYR